MSMPPDEMLILQAHVEKHVLHLSCPICKSIDWSFGGPVAELGYEEIPGADPAGAVTGQNVFPLVFVMCRICFYIHQFSWLALRGAAIATKADKSRG